MAIHPVKTAASDGSSINVRAGTTASPMLQQDGNTRRVHRQKLHIRIHFMVV